ncbi:MAG: urease accessory protein UreD [Deltaproteobacteria bacterium]|nr:urease accessory protein UreD [Deltaproteobacteria bacterium]
MSVATSGYGELDFEKVGARTVVRTAFARNPLRLLTPRNHGVGAWVYTSTFGGGLVGGDHIDIRVHVRSHATAVILSQSTTKIYRSPAGTSQSIEGRVEAGGFLAMIPDAVSCFAESSFEQRQSYELAAGASLVLVDSMNCGRSGSGERWLFDRYRSQIRVSRNQKPIFLESLLLDSRAGELASRGGRFNAHCMLLLTGPELAEARSELLASVGQAHQYMSGACGGAQSRVRAEMVVSASPLGDDGVLLRLAATSSEQLTRAVRGFLDFLPRKLGDDPWQRKW